MTTTSHQPLERAQCGLAIAQLEYLVMYLDEIGPAGSAITGPQFERILAFMARLQPHAQEGKRVRDRQSAPKRAAAEQLAL